MYALVSILRIERNESKKADWLRMSNVDAFRNI